MISGKKVLWVAAGAAAAFLCVRYALPVALPFLLAAAVAVAAEPLVHRLSGKFPRSVSAGLGVSLTLVVLAGIVTLVGAVAVRQLGSIARSAPDLTSTVRQGIVALQDYMVRLADRAPESVRPALQRAALGVLDNETGILGQVTRKIPTYLTAALSSASSGAVALGTGIVASYLISARLPRLRQASKKWIPARWQEKTVPALKRVGRALLGWLKAQAKLCGVTWVILTVGFLVLGISHPVLLSGLIAVVDAVPILGTGTVLVPWAVVCLVQGQTLRAVGLLVTYGAAAVTRTVLEPRLVGRQLGLDPLLTLLALYLGYRLWGFTGLIFAPIIASAVKSLTTREV